MHLNMIKNQYEFDQKWLKTVLLLPIKSIKTVILKGLAIANFFFIN